MTARPATFVIPDGPTPSSKNWIAIGLAFVPAWVSQWYMNYVGPPLEKWESDWEGYHVTIMYGLIPETFEAVRQWVADAKVTLDDLSFDQTARLIRTKKGKEVWVVDVHSNKLEQLREQITERFGASDKFDGFVPLHLTLGYIEPPPTTLLS